MNRSPPTQNAPPSIVPSQIPMDSLELIRNRLNQVLQSLRKLSEQITYTQRNPKAKLPSYLSLLSQFQVLITQLQTIVAQLDANDEILRSTNVYPLPSFPTTQQEGLVTTLLRKKPLPEVDEWIDAAINESNGFRLPIQKDDEFAEWCHSKVKELEENFNFDGFHSEAELAYLETEEGKAEQQKKKAAEVERDNKQKSIVGSKPALKPNVVLKFMNRGVLD
ncbi:CIC11C00000004151 [Sungouiella intermedia]|uniref:Mediator of RNA polymerase II transcription subunit 8 n=1 Tax=Sungouiella intermedia TaxID=45354 RepID=A0A1L0GND7_9ASCO|nr:CIC11C00000004151 [[Candida] intermedia]